VGQDTLDRVSTDIVTQVVQRSANAGVSPAGILRGHTYDQLRDRHGSSRTPRGSGLGTVVLSRNQIAVPAQQCVRSDDAGHAAKRGSPKGLRAHSQPATMLVGQSHATLPQLLAKHAILFDKVVDPRLLSALNPAGERPWPSGPDARMAIARVRRDQAHDFGVAQDRP